MLVNPISFRLSVSIFWNSTWSLYKNNNYKYLFYSDLVFFEFLMFFFKKTLGQGSFFDYYSSHIRLYRIQDKIIINLYYHMAKDDYYFDDIDLMYKGFQKKVFLKENFLNKKNKKNLNKIKIKVNNDIINLVVNKLTKFIDINLVNLIYNKLIFVKVNNKNIYLFLKKKLFFYWKDLSINLDIKLDKLNFVNNNKEKSLIKKIILNYYLQLGKNYIIFLIKNKSLIEKYKKKRNKKFIYFWNTSTRNLQKLMNLKFIKLKKNKISKFLFPLKLILKQKQDLKEEKNNEKYLWNKDLLQNLFSNKYIKIKKENFLKNLSFNRNKKKVNFTFKGHRELIKLKLKLIKNLKENIYLKQKKNKKKNVLKLNKIESIIDKIKIIFYKMKSFKKLNFLKNKINILKKKPKFKKKYIKSNINITILNFLKNIKYKYVFNNKNIQILKNLIYIKNKKKNKIKKQNKLHYCNNFNFLYKLNFLKFIYNQKLWLYNIYYYYISKLLKKQTKFIFLKKIELNIFKIGTQAIRSSIISKYINSSLKHNYHVYETLRPVLVDLKQRMKNRKIAGFKIVISGRFKRALRATYWWKKDGHLLTATQTAGIDYNTSLYKTKYGVCTISVWLTPGIKGLGEFIYEYPTTSPFYFIIKKHKLLKFNYFLLKRNDLFFNNLLKRGNVLSYFLDKNYVKGLIITLLYKYFYTNIFLKNIGSNYKSDNIKKNLKKIFLPQYCIYKIDLDNFILRNYIKIIPFIQIKLLKRLNLRNSYKINILNKSKLIHLNIFKYKINLY